MPEPAASAACVFCQIIQGKIPAVKVYEDQAILTFMDLQPLNPGHTLTVPKTHAANLYEITEADLSVVAIASQRIARAVQAALKPGGIRIIQTNGAAAGQSVFHYHVHVIPMETGQRLNVHGRERASPEALEAVAAQIRAALAGC